MKSEALHGGSKPCSAPISLVARLMRSKMRGAVWLSACALGAVLLAGAGPAMAKEDLLKSQINKNATNQPLLLQADELIYDKKNDRIIAKGNVEVYYKNYALNADALTYDQKANTLDAVGNVRIKEPDGAVVNADRITLTDDFRDGFIRSFRGRDQGRGAHRRHQRCPQGRQYDGLREGRVYALQTVRKRSRRAADLADQSRQDHA